MELQESTWPYHDSSRCESLLLRVNRIGSHKQSKHPTKKGRATVPHPKHDIPMGTLESIEKRAGIKLR